MINFFKKPKTNSTEEQGAPKKIKTSAPKYKNFRDYVESMLKKRGRELSEATERKIEKYLEDPNAILNSPMRQAELSEMIKEKEFEKGTIGKWEVLYEKFILPFINQAENEMEKISKKPEPKKNDEENIKKEIMAMREGAGRISRNEITEEACYEAQEKYKKALKFLKKLPEDSPFKEEIKNNIIKPLRKYAITVLKAEQEINKIEKVEDLKKIIPECKKRIEEILDKIENFQHNGIDTILLKTYPKKLKDAAKRVGYKIEEDNNFKGLEKSIDKANEVLRGYMRNV